MTLSDEGTRRRVGAYAVGALVVLWILVGIALAAIIGLEALDRDDEGCPVPGLESAVGEEHWQWWPPGEVCTFADVRLVEPSPFRGAAIVLEVAVGIALLVAWRRYRDAPDPDWTE